MKKIVIVSILCLPFLAFLQKGNAPKMKLSEYGFFTGDMKQLIPAKHVMPYHLNTSLFTDFAEKERFVALPTGAIVPYNDTVVFDFPEGTTLIKNFYYPFDFRDPLKGRRIIETRLLIREASGWRALPYIWNEAQTDAELDVAGETTTVSYMDASGKKRTHSYVVPNMNQCKGCHNQQEKMMPIGPSAWQLNGEHSYEGVSENQIAHWVKAGILKDPGSPLPKGVVWNDPATGTLEERARIWLDINCAHCHRADGPASTSGLHLGWRESDKLKIGVEKTPVAAGRGSGNLRFGIVPGKPDESILLYRIKSNDPGVMMPELGRTLVQPEAVALIRDWIASMPR